jgi:predicted lipoprotein with Yx(FWY)xxD motif
MRNTSRATFGLLGIALIAGCSGGGSGGGPVTPSAPAITAAPVASAAPTATAAPATPASTTQPIPLQTATLDGAPAFETSAGFPVYEFANDTTDHSNCTGGCLSAWPFVPAPAGTLPSPFSSFTRSDNGQLQLAFGGAPLYTYSGDSPGVANGASVPGFSLARPSTSATTAPVPSPSPSATASAAAPPQPSATPYSPYAKRS